MKTVRKVKELVRGSAQQDGAGVKLVRVLGRDTVRNFDPFLMLDAFDSTNPDDYTKGFPFHPHRGIETVTYLVSGCIEHQDSMGNKGKITDGACQWMTAGSGIIHQEMPRPARRMLGLQLWINLPQKDKMADPAYRDLRADKIPVVAVDGAEVRVISGSFGQTEGVFQGEYVKTTLLDVTLAAGAEFRLPVAKGNTVFAYILEGTGAFEEGGENIVCKTAVLLGDGDEVCVRAAAGGMRFVLFSAKPLGEDVAWGGPVVMNTREEVRQAFGEIGAGTFIKHKPSGV